MPRPRRHRWVGRLPDTDYFKPAGIRKSNLEEATLKVDEFEAVRLKDYLGLDQTEAAEKMNISQPTFHRLLQSARKTIADAIVNGKALKIQGGNVKMIQERGRGYGQPAHTCRCLKCGHEQAKQLGVPCRSLKCPECGSPMTRGD